MDAASDETLYLVGFRIDPEVRDPQLYTLYVGCERPILRKGRPIVFARPDLAEAALQESDCGAPKVGPAPQEVYTVFDFAEALYILDSQDEAPKRGVVDCINVILDFVARVPDSMPTEYRSSLERLADHLTFHLRFAEFLQEQSISRENLTDAFFWSMGAVAGKDERGE